MNEIRAVCNRVCVRTNQPENYSIPDSVETQAYGLLVLGLVFVR